MTASVKVSGAWKTVSRASVNVSGTWKTISAGFVKVSGSWVRFLTSTITDSFNRANSSSLGNADTGQPWTTVRGTAWGITSNKATNSSSSYPIASVDIEMQDVTIGITGLPDTGAGVAMWVVDANNWWAVTLEKESYVTGSHSIANASWYCNDSTSSFVGNPYEMCPGTTHTYAVSWCSGHGGLNESTFTCTTGTENEYGYRSRMRVVKTASGSTNNNIASDGGTACSGIADELSVTTSGDTITATAKATGSTIGTKSYSASSPTKATKHGITSINASTSIDAFSVGA